MPGQPAPCCIQRSPPFSWRSYPPSKRALLSSCRAESGFNLTELLEEKHALLDQAWEATQAWEAEHCTPERFVPGADVPTRCTVRPS